MAWSELIQTGRVVTNTTYAYQKVKGFHDELFLEVLLYL